MPRSRTQAASLPKRRRLRSGGAVAMVFLAPALLTLVLTRLAPTVDTLISSFRHGGAWSLANYAELGASTFRDAVVTTAIFNAIINPAQVLAAYALAVVLSQRLPAVGLWRTLIFLPMAVPPAVSTVVWGIWFRPNDGIVNSLLGIVGLPTQPFLTSPGQALYVIMVIASWIGVGYWMMFLVAGIQNVDTVIPGHIPVTSWDDFVEFQRFNADIVAAARAGKSDGQTPQQAAAAFDLAGRYPGYRSDRIEAAFQTIYDELP